MLIRFCIFFFYFHCYDSCFVVVKWCYKQLEIRQSIKNINLHHHSIKWFHFSLGCFWLRLHGIIMFFVVSPGQFMSSLINRGTLQIQAPKAQPLNKLSSFSITRFNYRVSTVLFKNWPNKIFFHFKNETWLLEVDLACY